MNRDRFDIKINGKSSQNQIASYLVKVVLGLRDKENEQGEVRLLGSGTAIPHVILVSEIIRSRIQGVSSIVEFESLEKEGNNPDEEFRKYNVPAIRIKLTINPTQADENQAGYQKPYDVGQDKHVELFDYVMMYAENLYFWAGGRNRDRRNKTENRDNYNFGNNRGRQDRIYNDRKTDNQVDSGNWNEDRKKFQDEQKNIEQNSNRQQQSDQQHKATLQNRGQPRDYNRRHDRDDGNQERREGERQHYTKRPTDQQQRNDYGRRPQPQRVEERQSETVVSRGNLRTRGGQAKNN